MVTIHIQTQHDEIMKKSWQISCKEVVHFPILKCFFYFSGKICNDNAIEQRNHQVLQCHADAESPWQHKL